MTLTVNSKLAKHLLKVRNFAEILLIDIWQMQLRTNTFTSKTKAKTRKLQFCTQNDRKVWKITGVINLSKLT